MQKQKEANGKQKIGIECECGFIVSGSSEKHAKACLKEHKRSETHRRLLAQKQDVGSGAIVVKPQKEEVIQS